MARPRKPSAVKQLEGNRSRREIPPELPLQGFPELESVDRTAEGHFRFLAAEFCCFLRRGDSPAVWKAGDLFEAYCQASAGRDFDAMYKLSAALDRAWGKLGIQVVDRQKLMAPVKEKPDEGEERFFRIA